MEKKENITRRDIFLIFGKLPREKEDQKLEEANAILKKYGIKAESLLIKVESAQNGEELKGSIEVNKAIKKFVKE